MLLEKFIEMRESAHNDSIHDMIENKFLGNKGPIPRNTFGKFQYIEISHLLVPFLFFQKMCKLYCILLERNRNQ